MKPAKAAVEWPLGKLSSESSMEFGSPEQIERSYMICLNPFPILMPLLGITGLQTVKK